MKKTTPYEILVRFNKIGNVAGAHVRYLDTYTDNGEVIAEKEGMAQSIAVAGQKGFPLKGILDELHISALKTIDEERGKHIADMDAKEAEIARLKQEAESDRFKHETEVARLKLELELAKNKNPDVLGEGS